MREQTLPRLKGHTGLLPGMLQRSKYSRLRNDSLTSLEDRPHPVPPPKADPGLTADPGRCQLGPRPPQVAPRPLPGPQGSSTLRGFIPRMASIRLHSPASLLGLRGQADRGGDPQRRTNWSSGPSNHRLLIPNRTPAVRPQGPCVQSPLSSLERTQRPITLRRIASHPWTAGCHPLSHRDSLTTSCSKASSTTSGTDGHILGGTENRAIHRHIKYMGSLEVTQSMRTLDFDTRMQVTREAISRLCEKTPGTKTTLKSRRPPCKGLLAVLGQSNLQFPGTSIILTISPDSLVLTTASRLQTIAHHPMQSISFASGGDPDMADYVAYVAKDPVNQRACHILECAPGRACEVINSIGEAFETRFRQLLSHTPSLLPTNHKSAVRVGSWSPARTDSHEDQQVSRDHDYCDHDYYNEIPGKVPPAGGIQDMRFSECLTDHAGIPRVCSSQPSSLYENCSLSDDTLAPPADCVSPEVRAEEHSPPADRLIQRALQEELWFHGRLGRSQAEKVLSCSGDFLVRESSSAPGQYVLSGMEGSAVRHLLLVDPQGQVRTRDQVFLSVSHLVRFHMESQMPIVSGSSELCLKQPVSHTL